MKLPGRPNLLLLLLLFCSFLVLPSPDIPLLSLSSCVTTSVASCLNASSTFVPSCFWYFIGIYFIFYWQGWSRVGLVWWFVSYIGWSGDCEPSCVIGVLYIIMRYWHVIYTKLRRHFPLSLSLSHTHTHTHTHTHSLTHSLNRSLTHSLTRSLAPTDG